MPIGTHGPAEAEVDFSDMDNIPLFMKRMPTSEQGQIENNPALEALQSLVYEGGPEGARSSLRLDTRERQALMTRAKDSYCRKLEGGGQHSIQG